MLLELRERFGDCSLELRVVALADELGVLRHLDVRRDPDILHFPLTVSPVERPAQRRDGAAVDQLRIAAYADEAAPCALADQGPVMVLLE